MFAFDHGAAGWSGVLLRMTRPRRLSADEVYGLLDLDPAVETDARDIDAVRAMLVRIPTSVSWAPVFGPLLEDEMPPAAGGRPRLRIVR